MFLQKTKHSFALENLSWTNKLGFRLKLFPVLSPQRNTSNPVKSLWKKYFILMSRKLHLPRLKTEARLVLQQTYRKSIFDRGILMTVTVQTRVCVPAYLTCVNTVIKQLELMKLTACAFSVCPFGFHFVFHSRTCASINCGFLFS